MNRRFCLMSCLTLLVASCLAPGQGQASVLLVDDPESSASRVDCDGVAAALFERRIGFTREALPEVDWDGLEAGSVRVLVACHLPLDDLPQAQVALGEWVSRGGGLMASGRSAVGLESVLGLIQSQPVAPSKLATRPLPITKQQAQGGLDASLESAGNAHTEVRFLPGHPVAFGVAWDGATTTEGPLPRWELPAIVRHWYVDGSEGGWPVYLPLVGEAEVVAHWFDQLDTWEALSSVPAMTVHEYGSGRVVYSGALPGVYSNWDWPRSWRTVITNAIEWTAGESIMPQLGLWPDANVAAFAWTGDTEKPAMRTAVPALLDLFETKGLTNFGSFYFTAQAGGDADTEGAIENPDIVQMVLQAGGEVAGHGDIHTAFSGQDYDTQRNRLASMRDLINPLLNSGQSISGFRAPYLSQDRTTFQALSDLGFDYDAGDADTWSQVTLPFMVGDLVQLPPSMPMDWSLLEDVQLSDADALAIWSDKLEYVIARGGLFSWLHHPWVIEGHLGVVTALLSEALAHGDLWFARQDDIATWWRARLDLQLILQEESDSILRISLSNTGSVEVSGASLWLYRPAGEAHAWRAWVDGKAVPLVARQRNLREFQVLSVDSLAGGQVVDIVIRRQDEVFRDRFEN